MLINYSSRILTDAIVDPERKIHHAVFRLSEDNRRSYSCGCQNLPGAIQTKRGETKSLLTRLSQLGKNSIKNRSTLPVMIHFKNAPAMIQ